MSCYCSDKTMYSKKIPELQLLPFTFPMFTQSFNHLNPVNRQLDHKGNIVRVNNLEKKILSVMTGFILLTSQWPLEGKKATSSHFMEEKLSCNHYNFDNNYSQNY